MTVQAKTFEFGVPWESGYGYSQAMQAGETVYISGQLSHNSNGDFVGAGDFERQMRMSLDNLDRVLERFGATRNQIVETTVLVMNLRENFDTTERLHAEYFDQHSPASTLIGVAALALPDQLFEISAVVRLDLKA